EILTALRDYEGVAVRGGNAAGKSAAGSVVVAWWRAGGPGRVALTTAPTDRQVRGVLWREIARRYRSARDWFGPATLGQTSLELQADWYAHGFTADSADGWQGVHADRVLVVINEASGVTDWAFEAAEAALA